MEKKYIEKMVSRLENCEMEYAKFGKLKNICLFSKDHVQVPVLSQVEDCFNESFAQEDDYDSENTILQADAQWAKDHHLELHPAITINDFTYRGDIDFVDIREAICAAYHERPNHCNLGEIWASEYNLRPYEEGEGIEW